VVFAVSESQSYGYFCTVKSIRTHSRCFESISKKTALLSDLRYGLRFRRDPDRDRSSLSIKARVHRQTHSGSDELVTSLAGPYPLQAVPFAVPGNRTDQGRPHAGQLSTVVLEGGRYRTDVDPLHSSRLRKPIRDFRILSSSSFTNESDRLISRLDSVLPRSPFRAARDFP
jgi:hypothetical protein